MPNGWKKNVDSKSISSRKSLGASSKKVLPPWKPGSYHRQLSTRTSKSSSKCSGRNKTRPSKIFLSTSVSKSNALREAKYSKGMIVKSGPIDREMTEVLTPIDTNDGDSVLDSQKPYDTDLNEFRERKYTEDYMKDLNKLLDIQKTDSPYGQPVSSYVLKSACEHGTPEWRSSYVGRWWKHRIDSATSIRAPNSSFWTVKYEDVFDDADEEYENCLKKLDEADYKDTEGNEGNEGNEDNEDNEDEEQQSTASLIAAAPGREEQQYILSEYLYLIIQAMQPMTVAPALVLSRDVANRLLDMDNSEMQSLLDSPTGLREKVREALNESALR